MVANISVGLDPTGVAVDAAAGRVFVANNGSDNVSVINASSHTVVASLPAGDGPVG
ncbi:40-residue YVTN family beta-propeller repeat-containing protein, partial [mine drainage metagenome]